MRCQFLYSNYPNRIPVANVWPTLKSCFWTRFHIVYVTIVDFFIPVSSLKVFDHSIHSKRRKIYREKSIQALQNDTLSYCDYSISGSSIQLCSGMLLKILCLFSSIFVYYKKFQGSRLLKYLNQYRTHRLPATKYKPKLLHGLTCYFMLGRLHWCAKQRNRTSVLLGYLW